MVIAATAASAAIRVREVFLKNGIMTRVYPPSREEQHWCVSVRIQRVENRQEYDNITFIVVAVASLIPTQEYAVTLGLNHVWNKGYGYEVADVRMVTARMTIIMS